jgi:hypothetical protein
MARHDPVQTHADQSPVKAMAFLLQEEAIRWLQMF